MRKRITFITALSILTINTFVYAVPADYTLHEVKQPNRASFFARQVGDEWASHIETEEGYSIVRTSTGWWVYTEKINGQLRPTPARVGYIDPKYLRLPKHLHPDIPYENKLQQSQLWQQMNTTQAASVLSPKPISGTKEIIVLLVEFTDKKHDSRHDTAYYENILNKMNNYFQEVSYNNLSITGHVAGWYSSQHTLSYYGEDGVQGHDNKNTDIYELTREVVKLADKDINFSQYDDDGNSIVDHLMVIYAGDSQATDWWSNLFNDNIWPHRWSIKPNGELTNDNVSVLNYMMVAESSGLGTFCHEFFHDFDAPDLYDTDAQDRGEPVGRWCLMADGAHLDDGKTPGHVCGYLKWKIGGWLDPKIITYNGSGFVINQLETLGAQDLLRIDIPTTNQIFLIENRQKTGYDSKLPDEGLLIYHIDENMPDNDGPPNNPYYRVWVEDPTFLPVIFGQKNGSAYSANDFQTEFTPQTNPNSNANDGTPTRIFVTKISSSGSTMTFDAKIGPEITITNPTESAPASAGHPNSPDDIELDATVDGLIDAPLPTYSNTDFSVKIGEKSATVKRVDLQSRSGKIHKYKLTITPPLQAASGLYNLKVVLGPSSDLEKNAVRYEGTLSTVLADFALIIDSSGSMTSNDPNNLRKDAAKFFIDLAEPRVQIAIVDFDSGVRTWAPLTLVDTPARKADLKNAVNKVDSSGGTDLGLGLQRGYDELRASAFPTVKKSAVMLTDGQGNYSGQASLYTTKGWSIYTVGLGREIDEKLLKQIAESTPEGEYFPVSLSNMQTIYNQILAKVSDLSTLSTLKGFINQDQEIVKKVMVDDVEQVKFAANWEGSRIDLVLSDPASKEITPADAASNPNIDYQESDTFAFYVVNHPLPGEWSLKTKGTSIPPQGEQYNLTVTATSDYVTNLLGFNPTYSVGDTIRVGIRVKERFGDSFESVLGAKASAEIVRPDGKVETLALFDDGSHSDMNPSDGVYANNYTKVDKPGTYLFRVTATNSFSRVIQEQVIVGAIENVYIDGSTLTPAVGATLDKSPDVVSAVISGPAGYIDTKSIQLILNGQVVQPQYDAVNQLVSYQSPEPLRNGLHTVKLSLNDTRGNPIETDWFFTVNVVEVVVPVVIAEDGSGTLVVEPSIVPAGSADNEIVFTYAADGKIVNGLLRLTIPQGWTPPQTETPDAPGYTIDYALSIAKGTLISPPIIQGQHIVIPITRLGDKESIQIVYGRGEGSAGVTPGTTAEFTVESRGSADGTSKKIAKSPTISVMSADGSGTVNVTPSAVSAGSAGNELTLTFTATLPIRAGSITVTVPADWSAPQGSTDTAGFTRVTSSGMIGAPTFEGYVVTVPVTKLLIGDIITVTYGKGGGLSGAIAGAEGTATFRVSSSGTPKGTLTPIASFPNMAVHPPNGSGTATISPSVVFENSTGNTITVTYTAQGTMDEGWIAVDVPENWSAPHDKLGEAGYTIVSTTGHVSAPAFISHRMRVKITTLKAGETVTFVYGSGGGNSGAIAPVDGTYEFTVSSASVPSATFTPIAQSPSVTVSTLKSITVTGSPVRAGRTVTVTAIGKPGATATLSIGTLVMEQVMTESVAGTYTGTFTPVAGQHPEGTYDVVVKLGMSRQIASGGVVIDNTLPAFTTVKADPTAIKNGQTLTLTAVASESGLSVQADVSALDSTQSVPVDFVESRTTGGSYRASIVISGGNSAQNGPKVVTITAIDAAGNVAVAKTVTVDLRNFAEFELSVPKDIGTLHIPLKVMAVGTQTKALKTIGDFFDALGPDNVSLIITRDSAAGVWRSYLGSQSRGTLADQTLTDDMGIITVMKNPVTLRLKGEALGVNGKAQIKLQKGTNLVGVPLLSESLKRVSDLLRLADIKDNATSLIVSDSGQFKVVARPGDVGDIDLTGGQSFIVTARTGGVAEITGEAWDNVSGSAPAVPPIARLGHSIDGGTPVLAVHGTVVDEVTGAAKDGFRITVRNLSTGDFLNTLSGSDAPQGSYSMTLVDFTSCRVAQVGDILEITVESPSPLIGVHPLRHIVSTDDVQASQIRLPDLVAYEIPLKTALLSNYPNPFNPETWIPYRLAKESSVTLTIYDMTGRRVRTIDVGHKPAAVYESKHKAIYWDGRNDWGERVASSIYFYTLTANTFSETRKMLLLK